MSATIRPFPRASYRLWIAAGLLVAAAGAAHATGNVVISQVYGGGGNASAPLRNDFVELFNRSSSAINITGWSVQYSSSTGTGNFSGNAIATLSGVLQPGQHYLVQLAGNTAGNGVALPAPDATGTQDLSATNGKVALVLTTTGLACNGGSNPCSASQLAQIVDLVGYGNANFFEGAAAPVLSNSTAAIRGSGGCTDTDNNSADFTTGAPAPRNGATALAPCGGPINQPVVPNCPASLTVSAGVAGTANLSASDADGFVSTAAITSTAVTGVTLTSVVPGTPLTAQLSVSDVVAPGSYPVTVTFGNNDPTPQTASCTVAVNVQGTAPVVRIHDIQGSAHISPLNGQAVSRVPGIVTSLRSNGFYMQDPTPDANPATSEGIFVFTSSTPTVAVGDSVEVGGTVQEFRPGGSDGLSNLTMTEISGPSVVRLSSGNALPAPVVLGIGGRAIPAMVIEDDASGSVETSGTFDPATDGIDFYESLEGMLVRINNAVVVGPTNSFGEIPVVADNGVNAGLRSARGGLVISSDDFNPERLTLDDTAVSTPTVNVGDGFASVTAIVDYSFGNFKFDITEPLTPINNGLSAETTTLVATSAQLTVGSFNVQNLAPTDSPAKFAALAAQIVNGLRTPDIVALMEIQDNSGATDDGVVDATTTFSALITAIQNAGGPAYQFRNINPVNDQDGGAPGGNIRVGFLFNPTRVSFVDRAGGGSTVATTVVSGPSGPQLSASPGRIDPSNPAFANSRKPLAAEFLFNGRRLFVIANHFNSKLGDDPLFGRWQPPVRSSEAQRHQQATIVNGFVQSILTLNPNAAMVVLGDLNDFEFSETLTLLKGSGTLTDLVETLPANERYTYVFEGNSQVLDHILVSSALVTYAHAEIDIVHANAEFAAQVTDHDPDLARLDLGKPGDVDRDGDIDRTDIDAISAARDSPANGPYDPRDMNGDGRIDALDVRLATNACTRARCSVQ
jgi:predicted extracellular nuclease